MELAFTTGFNLRERLEAIENDPLLRRLNAIIVFRNEHYKLEMVLKSTKFDQDWANQTQKDVEEAYISFIMDMKDVLDITLNG